MDTIPSQFAPFDIPADKVLARLGYSREKTRIDDATQEILARGLVEAKQLIQGRQVRSSANINREAPNQVLLDPGLVIASKDILLLLEGCGAAHGFAVTIGPFLETKRNEYLQAGEVTRALVLDAAGSVAAEFLAAETHKQIAEEAAPGGLKTTKRFSPGYGDWGLDGQPAFLEWLGADAIGIRLTKQFQMLPEKSVSAIVGLKQK